MAQRDFRKIVESMFRDVYSCKNVKELSRVIPNFFCEDVKLIDPAAQNFRGGMNNYLKLEEMYLTAFPDKRSSIDFMSVSDNFVTVCWTCEGTHTGALGSIQPSGNKFRISGISIFEFDDSGKIRQIRNMWDRLALLEQIEQLRPVPVLH